MARRFPRLFEWLPQNFALHLLRLLFFIYLYVATMRTIHLLSLPRAFFEANRSNKRHEVHRKYFDYICHVLKNVLYVWYVCAGVFVL